MCAYVVPTYEIAQDSARLDIFAIMANDICLFEYCLADRYKMMKRLPH